jgi:hypothetical protein
LIKSYGKTVLETGLDPLLTGRKARLTPRINASQEGGRTLDDFPG